MAKDRQIARLQDIIEDYRRREAKMKEDIHIKQSMYITVGRSQASGSPSPSRRGENKKLETEITLLNVKIEKLTKENCKLKASKLRG